jgi:catechol 2,3-dioxygenase-like lactoylglutathione lyase family enzyme
MQDRITANLPARNFDETAAFYGALGFSTAYRDAGWMIVRRGTLEIEFFQHADCDPASSWFSACVRINDADALYRAWQPAALPTYGIPRMTPPATEQGLRIFAVVDPNGSLLRCISSLDSPG